jgi:thioredoxin 1
MAVNNGVEEISGNHFEERIKKGLFVVDFFAEWCMPCVMITPIIEELADKFKGKINFLKANVDENSALSNKFKVMSIPCLIVFKDGKEVDRLIGNQSADVLEEKLKKII